MQNPALFIVFFTIAILALGCTKQPTDDPTVKRSGKSILEVRVLNDNPDFPAVIQIDSVHDIVNIYTSYQPYVVNVSLFVKVSPGAELLNNYTDFTIPRTYTVKAEDGSLRSYTIIVSQVQFVWQLENIIPSTLLSVYQNICYSTINNKLTIDLGCGTNTGAGTLNTHVNVILPGKTLNDNLVGNYNIGPLPGSQASVDVEIKTGFSSSQYYTKPDQGILKILYYDPINKIISGSITQAGFNTLLQPSTEHYYLSGDFYNVPLK